MNWRSVGDKVVELVSSDVPTCVPKSYSDNGKSLVGGMILFAVHGISWILVTGSATGIFGPWSWLAAIVGWLIHRAVLYFDDGSRAKIDGIKADEKADDPVTSTPVDPSTPPLSGEPTPQDGTNK
jgi:hypothetical protein